MAQESVTTDCQAGHPRWSAWAILAAAVGLGLAGCTVGSDPAPSSGVERPGGLFPTERPDDRAVTGLPTLDPADSLTPNGSALAGGVDWSSRPAYHVVATLDPVSGRVDGTLTAELPVGDVGDAVFRFFAGLDELASDAKITAVVVDGSPAEPTVDQSLLRVPLPANHSDMIDIDLEFGYTLEEIAPADPFGDLFGGDSLAPASIGLLARHEQGLSLGHWFPLWMPSAEDASAVPDGFGDIGNFPAGRISAELSVPDGATVITGGVRVDETRSDGELVVRDEKRGPN